MVGKRQIIIFADGACLGNPGPGAAASIVADSKHVVELGYFESTTTNNRMEIFAVLQALGYLLKHEDHSADISVYCDSKYVLNGVQSWIRGWKSKGWRTAEGGDVKNKDLWLSIDELHSKLSKLHTFSWNYVPGHSGVPGNERCDEIATQLASGQELFLYEGSRSEYPTDLSELSPSKAKKKSNPVRTTASTYYVSLLGGSVHRDKTWKECEARVKGARGAKFKKVNSEVEELEVLKSWGVKT